MTVAATDDRNIIQEGTDSTTVNDQSVTQKVAVTEEGTVVVIENIVAQGFNDHGSLSGLGDDDHSQYILVSGLRAFTGTVSGITPTLDAHLATKKYVDDNAGGVSDHGALTGLSDDDHTQYILVDGTRAFTGTVSGITPTLSAHLSTKGYVDGAIISDHGALTGLADDDHSQDILVDGSRAFTGAVSGITPTLSAHLATKQYVDDNSGGGGVTDHGALTGLGDDDHTQYLLVDGSRAVNGTLDVVDKYQLGGVSVIRTSDGDLGGSENVSILGSETNILTGGANVYIGYGAGSSAGLALNNNTAVGNEAFMNGGGNDCCAFGHDSMKGATGNSNVAIGSRSLTSGTGSANVAIGFRAMNSPTSASRNICVGDFSLANITSANENCVIGRQAGEDITTGASNVLLGFQAGRNMTTQALNTFLGNEAGEDCVGSRNVAIGSDAGSDFAGNNNVAVGNEAGRQNGTGCVCIGFNAGENETGDNKLYIHNSNTTTPLIGGDFSAGTVDINGDFKATGSVINFANLPTSSSGLNAGDLWNDSGTIKVV